MTPAILPGRAVLSLEGPDTLALLERLVTNNTQNWASGEARYGALLTPQGKVIADFIAHRTDTGARLDVAEGAIDDLAKRLKMFRLRAKVEIERDDSLAVAIGTGTPDPRSADLPARAIVETDSHPAMKAAYWDALRIPAGIAEWGADFAAAEVFPWEINLDREGGVDLKKGCFVGQEVVSRTHRRGKIRKRTVVIEGENLEPGQELMAGNSVGEITSATSTHALARVRTDRLAKAIEAGETLTVGGQSAILKSTDWLSDEMAASLGDGDEPLT